MKRLFALLLCFVMSTSLLSGCGGGKDPAPSQDAPAEGSTTPETPASETVDTVILKEADDQMLNVYTLMAVDPSAPFTDTDGNSVPDVAINTAGADALIHWLLLPETLELAAGYGQEEFGDSLFYVRKDAPSYSGSVEAASDETRTIRLSTTTSVNDSGLLRALLPLFETAFGYTVEVQSAGTGKAIAAAKYGNADLILVHSKSQEESFAADGFARIVEGFDSARLSFLYNYFVLCGPSTDPARVKEAADVLDAFASIADGEHVFISRGDGSGTHTKELSLWPEELGITAEAESFANNTDWYISANTGMGACLVMAEEMSGYILTDKATYLTFFANNGVI